MKDCRLFEDAMKESKRDKDCIKWVGSIAESISRMYLITKVHLATIFSSPCMVWDVQQSVKSVCRHADILQRCEDGI